MRTFSVPLSGVFTDRHVTTGPLSAAFTGLLDLLVLADVYGVVAPALSHLGPKAIAAERTRHIEETGARLLLARPPRHTHLPSSRREPAHYPYPGSIRVLDTES
ncbi:hypothetical protein [Streptomyces sp. NPDC088925]|uniref:hypothetical protein n=1 Tax=Streptomyces sp. NPDC088925 TaxID=3365914 RepID=UPI0037FF7815